jgi:hypothetical protein
VRIEVEYQLDVRELIRGLKLARRRARVVGWCYLGLLFALGCLFLAVWDTTMGAFLITFTVVGSVLALTRQNAMARKQAPRLCVPTRLTLTDEHLSSETALVQSRISWSFFLKTVPSRDFVFLFMNPRQVIVVPRRALSAEQNAELDAFLAGRTPAPVEAPNPAPTA